MRLHFGWPKTSGGDGLHVCVRIDELLEWATSDERAGERPPEESGPD